MSHKSTTKPSSSHYSARTSSTGGNNHRSTTASSSSSSSRDPSADPYRRFLVSGTSSGRAESASRQLAQWDRDWAAASSPSRR